MKSQLNLAVDLLNKMVMSIVSSTIWRETQIANRIINDNCEN